MRSQVDKTHDAFTLQITLQGICALVPDVPFFANDHGTSRPGKVNHVQVFMPDLREVALAYWENRTNPPHPYYRASHAASLRVHPRDIAAHDNFNVSGSIHDPDTGELLSVHIMNQEILELPADQIRDPLTFEAAIPNDEQEPLPGKDPDLLQSLWWLPRMTEICPGHAVCKPLLLTAQPGDLKKLNIAGMMKLPGGHLSVVGFNRDATVSWNFGPVAPINGNTTNAIIARNNLTWRRAIGNRLQFRVRIYGSEAKLVLKAADNTQSQLVLRPHKAGGTVNLQLDNIELENVMLNPQCMTWQTNPLPDADFQAYYSMIANVPPLPWPVPVSASPASLEPGCWEKPCPIAELSAQ